jgi:hypothetical protein
METQEPNINQYDVFQFDTFQFDTFQIDGGQNYATKFGNRASKRINKVDINNKERNRNLLILLASLEDEL